MSQQTPVPPLLPDPIRVLENTRRTLLQLVANIDAAIAASKEPTRAGR